MKRVLIFMLLLTLPGAFAAQYWTVVRDNAPASDVVSAANFAATMKANAGVTFTGKLASDAKFELFAQSSPVLEVFFSGKSARIVEYPTGDEPEFSRAIEVAESYLRSQGFSVSREEPSLTGVDDVTPSGNDKLDNSGGSQEAVDDSAPAVDLEKPVLAQEEEQRVVGVDEQRATAQTPPPPPASEPEAPNLFVRMWRWFTGVFS